MTADELKLRMKRFALRVIKLVAALPKTIEGRAIANRSKFVAKMSVVLEVADETQLWLELIIESKLLPVKRVQSLFAEASKLVAIFVASRKSASSNLRSTI